MPSLARHGRTKATAKPEPPLGNPPEGPRMFLFRLLWLLYHLGYYHLASYYKH